MNCIKNSVILLGTFFILTSCKKAGADSVTSASAPSNLSVTAHVSMDGSGNVGFTATATNAATFVFEFGDAVNKTVASGVVNYQYTLEGSNTFTVTVTATSSTGVSIKKSIPVTVTVAAAVPVLFWSEEFNAEGAPDPAKWGYNLGTGDGGWGNQELQYYTSAPANVLVGGGILKITALKESFNGSPYTSTRLVSKDKFAFTYGKVEVRAKIPAGVGTWPAIWMLGSDINTSGWPACGEIDIMEHRGSELNKLFGTLHYPGRFGGNADGSTKLIANATTEFHLYSLDWSASSIKIYVDNVLLHVVANSASIPFNHDFFFILNIAMGGNFGGPVDPALTSATMEVDYVRVYK
jgi:beta-glucanase (GH16 family)